MAAQLHACMGVLMAAAMARTSGGGQVEVASLTDMIAAFSYADPSGRGLSVVSAQDSLHISTLDGRSLVAAEETSGDSLRLISLGPDVFIQAIKTGAAESRDFAVPGALRRSVRDADLAVLQDLVHILNTSSAAMESEGRLWDSLLAILNYAEMQMLEDATAALGSAGVTGLKYPCTLPFYTASLRLSQLLRDSNLTTGRHRRNAKGPRMAENCLSECPPCQDQECLGLCGYGCNCWKWICGDCCYHLGCYEHDLCCREKFVRTSCLFPFKFKCESGYNCN